MNELIKITEHNGREAVSARDLHTFLESRQDFSTWIKNRIEKYDLIENQDYVTAPQNYGTANGGHSTRTEYALSIDAAKELSMVEGNERGKEARRYFIECEKKKKLLESSPIWDFSDPDTVVKIVQNWRDEYHKRAEAERQVELLSPKAALADRVMDCGEKIDIGQAAKILDLPFGRNTLFKKLRENGTFFKERNEPKQIYVDKGYFELKQVYIERAAHEGFTATKVLVTQPGLAFLADMFDVKHTLKAVEINDEEA